MQQSRGFIDQRAWALVAAILLFAGAIAVFKPARGYDFVFTDTTVVKENRDIRSFDNDGLRKIFFERKYENYIPLRMLAYAAAYKSKGYDPAAFHTMNILFHALTCVMVFLFFSRLLAVSGLDRPGALVAAFSGAVIFLIHPVQVETVAWISSLKDAMAGFFTFSALLSFLVFRTSEKQKTGWYYLTLICFILALLSKATSAILPFIMIVFDVVYPQFERRKPFSHVLQEHGVFVILACVMSFLNYLMGGAMGAITEPVNGSVQAHIATALKLVPFYIGKAFAPSGLTVLYFKMVSPSIFNGVSLLSAAILVAAIVVFFTMRKKHPALAFSIGLFFIALAPVFQVLPIMSWAADRFMYVAIAGPALLVGLVVSAGIRNGNAMKIVTAILFAVALLVLGNKTTDRLDDWQSMVTLWQSNLEVNPDSVYSHLFLGQAYLEEDNFEKAKEHLEKAKEIDPGLSKVYAGLAYYYLKIDDVNNAYFEIKEGFKKNLANIEIHYLLARVYYESGTYDSAAKIFSLIEKHSPGYKDSGEYLELSLQFLRVTMEPVEFNKFLEKLKLTEDKAPEQK